MAMCSTRSMKPEEEGKLLMVLSLGYSEEYADRSINDLSDEELDSLIAVPYRTSPIPPIPFRKPPRAPS